MLTTLLEAVGMILIVAASFVAFGPAAALATAGACCLLTSWALVKR